MANTFTAQGVDATLRLSNGATSVLLDVVALAGSAIARTAWEQHLVLWFADSERVGYGISGFDLADLPWTGAAAAELAFLARVLELATSRYGWDRLHYDPVIEEPLQRYRQIVRAFAPIPVPAEKPGDWTLPPPAYTAQLCARHHVLHGEWMCRLCDPWLQPVDAAIAWDLMSLVQHGEDSDRRIRPLPDASLPMLATVTQTLEATRDRSAAIPANVIDQLTGLPGIELDPGWDHCILRSVA